MLSLLFIQLKYKLKLYSRGIDTDYIKMFSAQLDEENI